MTEARTEHFGMGVASFVLSFFPGLLFVVFLALVSRALRGLVEGKFVPDDGAGYAILGFFVVCTVLSCELAALGLGVAGTFQRGERGRWRFWEFRAAA